MNSSSFSPDPLSGFETLKNVFEAAVNQKQSAKSIY